MRTADKCAGSVLRINYPSTGLCLWSNATSSFGPFRRLQIRSRAAAYNMEVLLVWFL